jgi:N2-acetyl-L-2,4-diaminobutanoate deacetylase
MTDWESISQRDFELPSAGLHRLLVRLPYRHKGRENELRFPLIIARRGSGPSALVVGGTHGDEFEGQVAAMRLTDRLAAAPVSGTIIVVPQHNFPACRAGTRLSPLDGTDLNRIYPAKPGDGPSCAIATFLTEHILPASDTVIDIHSGGRKLEFVLSSNLQGRAGSPEVANDLPLLMAFDAPYAIIFDELGPDLAMPHTGTLEATARAMGKRTLSSEIGGGGRLSPASVEVAENGLRNVLSYLGVLPDPTAVPPERSRSVLLQLGRPEHYVASPADGMLVPHVQLGTGIRADSVIGEIRTIGTASDWKVPILAPTNGLVIAAAATGLVETGTTAFIIADPV